MIARYIPQHGPHRRRRPEWARRDWRPWIAAGAAGLFGALLIGGCVFVILAEVGGLW